MSDKKNNLYDKCVVCGSPYRHEKEIHTFICINKKCGYREWYPVRRYDIPNIIENARTQQKAEIVKLIEDMLNPIYKCKCGWKGVSDNMNYDSDAVEWNCLKCGNEINVGMNPKLQKSLQELKSKIEEMK